MKNKILKSAGFLFSLAMAALFLGLQGCKGATEKSEPEETKKRDYSPAKQIEIKETGEGGYSLYVNQEPFLIRGVVYNPTPVGKGPGYNFFTHQPKPWEVTDGQLMQDMGINAVRIYTAYDDLTATREFIRDLYQNYGIYTVVSDWLGLWHPAANYADPEFQKQVKNEVLEVVKALKNEPGVLMWMLGNENNYTFSGKIRFWTSPEIEKIERPYQRHQKRARIFYSFVDEIAAKIKKIDPSRPVALSNGEVSYLSTASEVCQNIDILAIIAYRGKVFGNMFDRARDIFDLPVVLSEFGCDSYDAYRQKEDQEIQAEFILSQWNDIYANTVAGSNKEGNVLGGFLFSWTDEWWKYNENCPESWLTQNTEACWSEGSYYHDILAENNLNMNEEWFGIVSVREEKQDGINKRVPKKAYYRLQEFFEKIK